MRWAWALGLVVAVSMSAMPPAAAGSDLSNRLKQEKADLEQLKKRIKQQNKSISIAGAKESSLLKTLRKIDQRLEVQTKELNVLHLSIDENKQQIEALEKRLKNSQGQVQGHNAMMAGRLRAMYKEGPLFGIKALFSSDGMVDLLRRIKYMQALAAFDAKLFKDYGEKNRLIRQKRDELIAAREKLLGLEENRRAKKLDIETQKKEKSLFLKEIRKERELGIKAREELVTASKNLNNLIGSLTEELHQSEGLDIARRKGQLKPPLEGRFLNKFGRKRDKHYDSYIVYNGIDIQATKGTPVHAVFSGKVLYAGPLEGYGNLIILGHGTEHHSLYGHLDDIGVKVGQSIRTGDIIGHSGDTGSLVGETLYFEMRHKGKPIEPTRWFNLVKQ